jgi:hypothetical protein
MPTQSKNPTKKPTGSIHKNARLSKEFVIQQKPQELAAAKTQSIVISIYSPPKTTSIYYTPEQPRKQA